MVFCCHCIVVKGLSDLGSVRSGLECFVSESGELKSCRIPLDNREPGLNQSGVVPAALDGERDTGNLFIRNHFMYLRFKS